MKKVNNILPSILYLLIFISIFGLIIYSILNIESVNSGNLYKKIVGEKISREYQLNKGVNFIGLDFKSKNFASKILRSNENILLIANFEDGQWNKVIKKSSKKPIIFNNFVLKEYKGYLIIVEKDTNLVINGRKRNKKIDYKLDEGWNLIGAVNYGTSNELVSKLKNEDIDVLGVANWSDSLGTFINYKSINNKIYGEDFTLNNQDGVFVKVEKR